MSSFSLQAGSDDDTITRLGFEKAMKDARVQTALAVSAQVELFREMCEASPRMPVLQAKSDTLCVASAAADKAFTVMFAINAQVRSIAGWDRRPANETSRTFLAFRVSPALRLFSLFNEMVRGLR